MYHLVIERWNHKPAYMEGYETLADARAALWALAAHFVETLPAGVPRPQMLANHHLQVCYEDYCVVFIEEAETCRVVPDFTRG